MASFIDPYMNDPFDRGAPLLKPGFRHANAAEVRGWCHGSTTPETLRRLYRAAKVADGEILIMDDVFGGTNWRRNHEGHGALVVSASVLEEALKPVSV